MKMSDVRVGMRLRSTIGGGPAFSHITVTEITERGFKYCLDADVPFIAREGSYFTKDGGEHYGYNGETFYEPEDIAASPVAEQTAAPVEERIAHIIGQVERNYGLDAREAKTMLEAYRGELRAALARETEWRGHAGWWMNKANELNARAENFEKMANELSTGNQAATAEVERLRGALGFYADWNNWNSGLKAEMHKTIEITEGPAHFIAKTGKRLAEALVDHGKRAREALTAAPGEGEKI